MMVASRFSWSSRLVLAAGLAAMAQPAYAQSEAAPEAAEASGPQDIVVTAQRRPERVQDIPVAVTAFTESTIRQLNLNDTITVSKFVPSMISQHNAGLASANAYYLRGLGNSQSVATFDPPVGTYVDNVYIARQNANNYAFFDTERVEVLRGPQGTLFGRNTTGGAISVIMRKPSEEYGAKFEASVGSYNRVTTKAIVDVPISQAVLTKVSAFYIYDGGYLKNITTGERLNGERSYGIRGDIRFLPTDDLTFDLSGEFTSNTGTYLGMRGIPVPSPRFRTTTTPVFYENATNMTKTSCDGDVVTILLTTGNGLCSLSESYAITGNLNYVTDVGTLEIIGGWRKLDQGYINNYSASTVNKFAGYVLADESVNKQHSLEAKWTGELADGRLKYVGGLFYLKEINTLASADFQGAAAATSYNLLADRHFKQTVETAAAYLQADYEVVTDLTLTVGARYTWEEKNLEFFRSARFPGFGFDSAAASAAGIPLRLTEKRVTPRFALSYKIDPNVMVFASVTNGFKSGGWNGNAAVPSRVLPFRPEVTWSYEGGIKSELFDRKLRLNLTGYLADTKDIQITSGIIPPGETAIVSLARNAGTLRAYGIEWETAYQFNPNFNIFVNGSFNKGEYTKIVLTPGVPASLQVQESTEPVRIPKFQLSSGATFKVPVDALGGSFGLTAAYRHNSEYWVALLNTAQAPTEDFLDLQVSFEDDGARYGVSFGVTNLTEQETITANFLSLFPGDPRRFTGRLWFNF
jgi:iron complex outermembrane recepter protein